MSQSRIAALFATAIFLAAAIAACGGSSGGSSGPQGIVDEATLEGIESGNLDLSVGVDAKGEKGGRLEISVAGPFQSQSEGEVPELDLTASAKGKLRGEAVDFEGGLTLLSGRRAYVQYEGVEYEVDPVTYGFVRGKAKLGGNSGASEATACQDSVAGLDLGDFVEDAREGGTVDVGGTETTKFSGDLDTAAAIGALIELTEDPACNEQLEAVSGSLPSTEELEKAEGEAPDAVKRAHVELYVGDDRIVRRLTAQATVEPSRSTGIEGVGSVALDVDLTLTGVNEPQKVAPPKSSQPLTDLFSKLGVTPYELLETLEGKGGLGRGGVNGLLEEIFGLGDGR